MADMPLDPSVFYQFPQGGAAVPCVVMEGAPSDTNPNDALPAPYFWLDSLTENLYFQGSISGPSWALIASGSGSIVSVLGTTNQITVNTVAGVSTISLPVAITAPGSLTATTSLAAGTTITAGTTLTATLGNITATNGNFVATAAGTGIVLNSAQASGAAASPVVVNGRSGRATFTSVSIAAAADLTLTLTNSAITASTTEVMLSMSGATTGSALSIKSKTASAGSLAIVVTNGTGATTTTADIQIDFLVLNT